MSKISDEQQFLCTAVSMMQRRYPSSLILYIINQSHSWCELSYPQLVNQSGQLEQIHLPRSMLYY